MTSWATWFWKNDAVHVGMLPYMHSAIRRHCSYVYGKWCAL